MCNEFKDTIYKHLSPEYQIKLSEDLEQMQLFINSERCHFRLSKSDMNYIASKHLKACIKGEIKEDKLNNECLTKKINIRSDFYFRKELFKIIKEHKVFFEQTLNKNIYFKEDEIYISSFLKDKTFKIPIVWEDAQKQCKYNIYIHKNNANSTKDLYQKCNILYGIKFTKDEYIKYFPNKPDNLIIIDKFSDYIYVGNYIIGTDEIYSSKMRVGSNPEDNKMFTDTYNLLQHITNHIGNPNTGQLYSLEYYIIPI
jgi:hypothetical protein